jgi:2'-5' RNA ligase
MRLFLAIDLPKRVKKQIYTKIEKIRSEYSQYRWVSEENYHITLYFFGETDKVDRIKEKIEKIIWQIDLFYLYSRSVDMFSNEKHVLYLDFYRQKELEKLAQNLREIFDPQNKNKKKFIPHLTLARGKRSSKQQYFALSKKLNEINLNVNFPVEKITLFESILTADKPIYKKIAEFPLALK